MLVPGDSFVAHRNDSLLKTENAVHVTRVLVVDPERSGYIRTRDLLARVEYGAFYVEWASDYASAVHAIKSGRHDVLLVDFYLGGHDALDVLLFVAKSACPTPVIVVAPTADRRADLESMRHGAADYLHEGDLDPTRLERAIRYALDRARTLESLRISESRHRHDALHDALTGLPNRKLFLKRTTRSIEHSRRQNRLFAILFLDFDRFKVINDSLGHLAGDELLLKISRRLEACVRPEDMVARMGGDEFAILLDGVSGASDAVRVAERVHGAFLAPMRVHGHDVFTSASIGIALGTRHYALPDEILRDADIAMYRAKALGNGKHVVFDRVMHEKAMKDLRLEMDLQRASDDLQFRVFFQRIVDIGTGEPRGLEALLRWQHPSDGLLLPGAFLPMAEETGALVPVEIWVLHEACERMRSWRKDQSHEKGRSMGVNVSSRLLARPNLDRQLARILSETEIDPSQLRLELTENAITKHSDWALRQLKKLKSLGIRLCLDDFGTGSSSLSHLHRLPIDAIKIDRSFVQAMPQGGRHADIVEAIISLGKKLHVDVLAEGIESESQRQKLLQLGCDLGQGFLFHAAAPWDQAGI